MPDVLNATAWTATLVGAYLAFAGIGALRNPTAWQTMIAEVGRSPALQLLAGLMELMFGAVVYLANPWLPASDLLSCVLKAAGGLAMMEALMIAGFCDVYANFWLRTMDHMHRGWSVLIIVIGVALSFAGMLRFH